jgi:molybdate transport system substrate-binding protein
MARPRTARVATVLVLLVSAGTSAETLRVSAAASLTEVFREVAAIHERMHPGDSVELNFAGSQVLRTQIEQGAPVDVFASADLVHAEALQKARLLGSFQVFARNALVVVVPAGESRVRGLVDLARPGTKLVVAGAAVPVGRYTAEVLARLGASGFYGEAFPDRVRANIVSEESNVRAVLSKVALGEADAGFVYRTDAEGEKDKTRTIEIPAPYNVVAEYAIGVLRGSHAPKDAQGFVDLVLGPEGQAILRAHGFAR